MNTWHDPAAVKTRRRVPTAECIATICELKRFNFVIQTMLLEQGKAGSLYIPSAEICRLSVTTDAIGLRRKTVAIRRF
jgi:hypothetical protein